MVTIEQRFVSGILALGVTWNYAYSPFNIVFSTLEITRTVPLQLYFLHNESRYIMRTMRELVRLYIQCIHN